MLILACFLPISPALAQTTAGASDSAPATSATDSRPELRDALPQGRLLGKARLSVWGFQVYDARLWAAAGFGASRYASTPLALELSYLRNFTAADIAGRSIKEMRRSQTINDDQATRWTTEMLRVIPDVRTGDRIMGVYRPGIGAAFWVNGKSHGEIRDAEFAKLFFGIWLSAKTSEPAMRDALLAGGGE
ncbi:MAG: hypothetical protein HHJ19_07980 [Polaromonas sp.]|nr:hypothetical protein [Polaromonas sp.]